MTSDTGKCGTRAGYMRHWRKGEPACYPCLDAASAARKASHRARRERARRGRYGSDGIDYDGLARGGARTGEEQA